MRPTAGVQILLLSHTINRQAATQSFGQAAIQDVLDVLHDEVYGHWRETESEGEVTFELFFFFSQFNVPQFNVCKSHKSYCNYFAHFTMARELIHHSKSPAG